MVPNDDDKKLGQVFKQRLLPDNDPVLWLKDEQFKSVLEDDDDKLKNTVDEKFPEFLEYHFLLNE